MSNLSSGDTVLVQKYLDLNNNGVIETNDWMVQQFQLTDGQAGMVIGGIVNSNVPGDTDTTPGQITAQLSFLNGDFMQNIAGQYLFKLSSPSGHFAPITNLFNVTNSPCAQKFTGNVVSNGGSTLLPNAVVLLFPPPKPGKGGPDGSPLAGTVANNSGSYTIQAPAGTYMPVAFQSNYLADFATSPVLTLSNGQTISTNLTVTAANSSISGKLVDATNSNFGLPGVFVTVSASSGLFGVGFTASNGNFIVGVASSPTQWGLGADDKSLIVHGYVGLNNNINVNAGQTNVTLAVPQATALFYGSVKDSLGNPMPGLDLSPSDNTNGYDTDAYTDANGNYAAGALGGLTNDAWQIQVSTKNTPANYLFSQPDFDSNGGTNLTANMAVKVKFTALLVTNYISGCLKNGSGNPITNVGIFANATINGVYYNQGNANTDTNGNYSFSVANGTWSVGVNSCGDCGNSLPGAYLPPQNQTVVISNNNGTANFTALSATNLISGFLKDNNGNPVVGVGIYASATINGVDYNLGNADTDTNGNYSLNVANGTWSVGVNNCSDCGSGDSLPGNYLQPQNQTVVISNNNGTANFTAPLATNYISGHLKDGSGNPIAGIGIYANATINGVNYNPGNADTDTNGYYSLNVANGNWSVGVNTCSDCGNNDSLPGDYLSPQNQTLVISNNNPTVNFTAILAPYQITGYIKDNSGNPVVGAGLWASATINGAQCSQNNANTDTNGNYSLNVANGAWQVGVNGYGNNGGLSANLLCPSAQSVVISNHNGTVNWTVLVATNHISGHVQQINGNPIASVGVNAGATINGVNYGQYVDSDGSGNYSLNVVNGYWTLSLQNGAGPGDSLGAILGGGNYQPPTNQYVTIANNNGTANFTVQSCSGVTITTTSLPASQVNLYYDQFLQASSCNSTFTWSLISGSLPPGLNYYPSTGEIYGTPTNAGTFPFTVQVTDGNDNSTNQSLSIYIAPSSSPTVVLTAPVRPGNGQFQFGFSSASGVSYTIQYSTNLKSWTPLLELTGSGGTETITDPNAGGSSPRFYRIKTNP